MSFDLNINNYKRHELIKMFDLPDNFDKFLVEKRENKMKDNILNDKKIGEEMKNKTIQFLFQAKNILLENIQPLLTLEKNIGELYNTVYDLKPINVDQDNDHMVQERKNKPYLSSFPSEFFPGVINPLKKKVTRLYLNVDTRFRDNYYGSASSNFNLSCPVHINNVMTMQLTAIELPLTFYNISKQYDNNFFTITVNDESKTVMLPDGNYDQNGMMAIINKSLQNLGGNFQYILFEINISNGNGTGNTFVTVNTSYTNSTPLQFSLDFQANRFGLYDDNTPLPLKFGWLLGFRNGAYVNNASYVSEGLFDLQSSRYLYLCVDDYNNNVNNGFYSAFNSSILNKNILARISLPSNANILVESNFNVVTQPREYFGPVNINSLNIQLLDAYGRVVDLNNMDYSFCLTFQTVYDI